MLGPPTERHLQLPAGTFRVLEWPGADRADRARVFLHGLTATADVWKATIAALGPNRPRCVAFDQRGHGHAPRGDIDYRASAFVDDLIALLDALNLDRPHLVGHSMGGRVAMVATARHPDRFRSVAIVDIGPEQWKANADATTAALAGLPSSFANETEAVAFGSRGRAFEEPWRSAFFARLDEHDDGSYRWLASPGDLARIVHLHRSRNYWHQWERTTVPTLLVRGERSTELRPRIAAEMQRRNPAAQFVEFPSTPHNIPLAAPVLLAETLASFWAGA